MAMTEQQASVRELAIAAYHAQLAEEDARRQNREREQTGVQIDELRRFVNGVIKVDYSRLPIEMISSPRDGFVPSILVEPGLRLAVIGLSRKWVVHFLPECTVCGARGWSPVTTIEQLGQLMDAEHGAAPPCICDNWRAMPPSVAEHVVDGHIRGARGFCERCGSPWPCPTAARDIIANGGTL